MEYIYLKSALLLVAGLLIASTSTAQTARTESELRAPETPYTIRASDVIGATVVNGDNEELGTVDDIVIVRSSGELHAIVSVGGVLGIGEALYAVAFDALKAGSSDDRVFLDLSRERFTSRPEFHYAEGESSGQQIWEKRLALKKRIQEKEREVKDESKDVLEKKREIRELERRLEELKRQ